MTGVRFVTLAGRTLHNDDLDVAGVEQAVRKGSVITGYEVFAPDIVWSVNGRLIVEWTAKP